MATQLARPPADLVDLYQEFGVSEIARRENTTRDTVYGWLRAADVELDAQRRGNFLERRECPTDFRERYIELGIDCCVEHYRSSKRTIIRWRNECGGDELRAARTEALRVTLARPPAKPARTPGSFPPLAENETSRAAAHWLRFRKHGGWVIARRQRDGMYFVGSMPMTPEQLIAFAVKRGFRGGGR